MNREIPWDLMVEKLNRTISAERSALLDEWLAEPGNKDIYIEAERLWRSLRSNVAHYEPDKERAWEILSSRMNAMDIPRKRPSKRYIFKMAGRIAASALAACLLLGAYFIVRPDIGKEADERFSYTNDSDDNRARFALPDGSSVWLRSGSSLDYRENGRKKQREVELRGEAFFDVVPDTRRMFVVNSNNVAVKVYGTKFGVGFDQEDQDVSVVLVEGSVSLSAENRELMLSPGESAEYNKLTGTWYLEKTDSELAAVWTMDRLRFEDKPLGHICKYLAAWYDIEIELSPELTGGQAYNFTVTDQSKEEIIAMLAKVTGFSYYFDSSGVLHIE